MKYALILFAIFLCACGECEFADNNPHDITWPNGECHGVIKAVVVVASEWQDSGTQFIAQCDDGRIVYNLSNFIVK